MKGLGFRGLGFRGLGFGGLGFRGLGFRGLGFRVKHRILKLRESLAPLRSGAPRAANSSNQTNGLGPRFCVQGYTPA